MGAKRHENVVDQCVNRRSMIILARTDSTSMSHILVPTDTPGVHIGPNEIKKMGLKGSPTNAVTFDDARYRWKICFGVEGRGLQQTLEVLDAGRISIGALAVGLAQAADLRRRCNMRKSARHLATIAQFQAIQWMLADAATEIQAAHDGLLGSVDEGSRSTFHQGLQWGSNGETVCD